MARTSAKKISQKKKMKNKLPDSVDDLMNRAEQAMASDCSLALTLYDRGEARNSVGNEDGARDDFLKGIRTIEETESEEWEHLDVLADLYLYLGQLCEEEEALLACQKGITNFKKCLEILEPGTADCGEKYKASVDIRQKISSAYCTVAELYLTDLCYAQGAESCCEDAVSCSLKYDSGTSPGSLQALASLRLSQSRCHEATFSMLQAWDRIKVGCEALASMVGLGKDEPKNELEHVEEASSLPGFEFRCQSAKLLLECAGLMSEMDNPRQNESNQCCEAAVQVLGSLLAENDEVIEIWYLVGCAFLMFEPKNTEMSKFYFERALEMLKRVHKDLNGPENGRDDKEELECEIKEVGEQMKEIREKLDELVVNMDDS